MKEIMQGKQIIFALHAGFLQSANDEIFMTAAGRTRRIEDLKGYGALTAIYTYEFIRDNSTYKKVV
jgi:hypothetical protein